MLTSKASETSNTTDLLIAGMRDSSCRQRIVSSLESLTGVIEVQVNFYRARATVVHQPPCSADELIQSIKRAGYVACLDQ